MLKKLTNNQKAEYPHNPSPTSKHSSSTLFTKQGMPTERGYSVSKEELIKPHVLVKGVPASNDEKDLEPKQFPRVRIQEPNEKNPAAPTKPTPVSNEHSISSVKQRVPGIRKAMLRA